MQIWLLGKVFLFFSKLAKGWEQLSWLVKKNTFFKKYFFKRFISLKYILNRSLSMQISTFWKRHREVLFIIRYHSLRFNWNTCTCNNFSLSLSLSLLIHYQHLYYHLQTSFTKNSHTGTQSSTGFYTLHLKEFTGFSWQATNRYRTDHSIKDEPLFVSGTQGLVFFFFFFTKRTPHFLHFFCLVTRQRGHYVRYKMMQKIKLDYWFSYLVLFEYYITKRLFFFFFFFFLNDELFSGRNIVEFYKFFFCVFFFCCGVCF